VILIIPYKSLSHEKEFTLSKLMMKVIYCPQRINVILIASTIVIK